MAARRTFSRGRAPSVRRGTDWVRLQLSTPVLVAAATKVLVATVVLANPGITETVIRIIGRFSLSSGEAAAVLDVNGAFGFIVINDLAVAAGAASIPGPVTDASDDGWFVWEPFNLTTNSGVVNTDMERFESKGARRVEEGFTMALMCENAHATVDLEFNIGFSILTKVNT